MTETPWFAIHTGPRMENIAAKHLDRQGIKVFAPHTVRKRWKRIAGQARGKIIGEKVPLLSRYIFGQFERTQISAVNDTKGVSTVVKLGPDYTEIPARVMRRLMEAADDTGVVGREDWTKLARVFSGKVGDNISFAPDSPFYGIAASIRSLQHLDSKGVLEVDLSGFRSARRVTVSIGTIAKVA